MDETLILSLRVDIREGYCTEIRYSHFARHLGGTERGVVPFPPA
jgi:hypothetical protein